MKVLILQPYGLGNAVCTTPLIQAVARLQEDQQTVHEVHVASDHARKAATTVLRECPGVKKILHTGDIHHIRDERYDMLIMCGDEPHLARSFGIPRVDTPFLARHRTERHEDWYSRWTKPEYDVLFEAARRLGWKAEMPAPCLPLPTGSLVKPEIARPILALGIGYYKGDGRSKKKHWGNFNFARLAWHFQRKIRGTVVLVGDKTDQEADGARLCAGTPGLVSLCGKLGFKAMLSLLCQVDAYVGNDTGLSHVAAALGKPTCVVFRRDASSPVKSKPWGPQVRTVQAAQGLSVYAWLYKVLEGAVVTH